MAGGLFVLGSLVPFVMLCLKKTERNGLELLPDQHITGNVQELQERDNLDDVGITGPLERTRNSVDGEVLIVSSV